MMFRRLGPLLLLSFAATAQAQLQMAVTFDDLPAHGQRPPAESRLQIAQSILDTLKREKLPPVYGFINGVKTEDDPVTMDVLKAWRAAGEPLGNHTWSHPDLETTNAPLFEAEIQANQPMLRMLMGTEDWRWFRYPFLHEGETVEKHRAIRAWLKANHYQVAEITLDFEDYLWNAPYARCLVTNDTAALEELHDTYLGTADRYLTVYRELAKSLYGHDIPYILLLHVGAFDAKMLPELLALYRGKGFSFVSLPEASKDAAYAEDPDSGYAGGGALTEQLAAKGKMKIIPNTKPYKRLETICR